MNRKTKKIAGMKFGHLIPLEKGYSKKNGRGMWRCLCECGNITNVRLDSLVSGRTKSCGCNKVKNLTGKKFGKLTVIKRIFPNKNRKAVWQCRCDCGKITDVQSSCLLNGNTRSCGCLRGGKITHGKTNTPIYNIWKGMLQRCYYKKHKHYKDYGGRGIQVDSKWKNSFEAFFTDMGDRPEGLTIDRINVNGNYCKANCRWATRTQQARNQRVRKNNKTGHRGVNWMKEYHRYQVRINANGKEIHLGYFTNLQDAAEARRQGEIKYWGKKE